MDLPRDLTLEELFAIIGRLTAENALLKKQLAALLPSPPPEPASPAGTEPR